MADNDRLPTLHSVSLSGTTKSWADALNDNFAELDERKTDIGNTATLVHDGSYVHTDNNFTDAYKAKLDEAEQNVQSDWSQSDSSADDYIKNKPTLGTAAAKDFTTSVTQNSGDLVTSGAVFSAIDNLPEPMVFKGTLGTGGTITTLPTAAVSNEGFTYKVITAGTYAGQSAKVGDVFTSNGTEWVLIPAGDDIEDTWRAINVNGTQVLGEGISSGAVNFKNGDNVTITGSGNDITISAVDTTYGLATAGGGMSAFAVGDEFATGDKLHFDTSKEAELLAWLQANVSSNITLLTGTNSNLQLVAQLVNGVYIIMVTDIGGSTQNYSVVYASDVMSGMIETAGFQYGNLELDENGDYTLLHNYAITAVDATEGWNGVLIGKSGGSGAGVDGLMSSADKGKLDGISAGANKVEASNTNGNIKIDGVETPVYVAPVIDQVSEYSFTSDDSRWGALSSGVYTLTIPSTKRPFICYNSNGEQVMATIGYNGTNITVKTDTKFAGKVLAI